MKYKVFCRGWGINQGVCTERVLLATALCVRCQQFKDRDVKNLVASATGLSRFDGLHTLREWVEHLYGEGMGFSLGNTDLALANLVLDDPIWDRDKETFTATFNAGADLVIYHLTDYGEPQDTSHIKWKK